jgi:hypothetical protein
MAPVGRLRETVDAERRWQTRRALVVATGVVILIVTLALVYALTGSDESFDPVHYQRVASECEASTDRALKTDGLELDGMTTSQRDEWIKENNACLRRRLGDVPLTTTAEGFDGS